MRVYAGGEIRAEIVPELFLMSRQQLFTPDAAVRQLPEAGITLAVAERPQRSTPEGGDYRGRQARLNDP